MKDFRQRSASSHDFAMIPRADIPRSSFRMQKTYKTTFNASDLIPVLCEEVLPGDSFNLTATMFGRVSPTVFPFFDNLYLDTFYFFVPNRLVWDNWVKFCGEQEQPGDSTSYIIPQMVSRAGGYLPGSLYDYFGLPIEGQMTAGETISHSALPIRAYALIWNEWFRDQNLQNAFTVPKDDGPDLFTEYVLEQRGKRHDYFTSCLPFAQKGTAVALPLGTSAPVYTDAAAFDPVRISLPNLTTHLGMDTTSPITYAASGSGIGDLYADLSAATAATINSIRLAFQVQKLLERDARGGTRYTEILRSHFGVVSPDSRWRSEYLGGGSQRITVSAVPQTSATDTGTPQANLAAYGTVVSRNGFTQSFTEHGYIIGLANVRADLTYQQGMRRHWSRQTRYEFYWPAFAMLGEQAVLNKEIYCTGVEATDEAVFGYQERWAEYRYNPSEITGLFRSNAAGTLDPWHLSQEFGSLPTLNGTFIRDATKAVLERVLAAGSEAANAQILLDAFYDVRVARPMPMYSVPGLIDHF